MNRRLTCSSLEECMRLRICWSGSACCWCASVVPRGCMNAHPLRSGRESPEYGVRLFQCWLRFILQILSEELNHLSRDRTLPAHRVRSKLAWAHSSKPLTYITPIAWGRSRCLPCLDSPLACKRESLSQWWVPPAAA